MAEPANKMRHESRDDHQPIDPLVAPPRPAAIDMDGRSVSSGELEAAAELSRVARRLGLDRRGINGFRLYAMYRSLAHLTSRSSQALMQIRIRRAGNR